MMFKYILTISISLIYIFGASAQEQARVYGDLQIATNFFMRDSGIGAANTPQYDYEFVGIDSWLNLHYSYMGFDVGARFDGFYNSNLPDPLDSYTGAGIGHWYVRKTVGDLSIAGGHIYDQIGSGMIFRAYEERPLFIDNALVGMRLQYEMLPNWQLKGFFGRQKDRFSTHEPFIKGVAIDGFYRSSDTARWSVSPGIGLVNRTLDNTTMNLMRATIATYGTDTFTPPYNVYAVTAYNTLNAGPVSWYVEGALKSAEAIVVPVTLTNGDKRNQLREKPGYVMYSSLSYAASGFAISLQGKYTRHFSFRTSPLETLNHGMIAYLPPMAKQHTYRLPSRYAPATQELGELAWMADVIYSPSRKVTFSLNASNITDLDKALLYREIYLENIYKPNRTWQVISGIQYQQYNQELYEVKPGEPMVSTVTPLIDVLYRIDRRRAIRTEWQYQYTRQDYGQWLFGLVEFTIAPNWAFAISDMINIVPLKGEEAEHYYSVMVSYTKRSNRFVASFVRQVEGIICTGGICRYEPAFSGVRLGITSTF